MLCCYPVWLTVAVVSLLCLVPHGQAFLNVPVAIHSQKHKKELISLSINWLPIQWSPMCVRVLVLEPHVCMRLCAVGAQRQRKHFTCSIGGRVHAKALEDLFSGALSYVQSSFLGHITSSRVRGRCLQSCHSYSFFHGVRSLYVLGLGVHLPPWALQSVVEPSVTLMLLLDLHRKCCINAYFSVLKMLPRLPSVGFLTIN